MTIYDLLKNIKEPKCDFNGYLEDYFEKLKPNDIGYSTFKMFYEFNPKLKICINLHFDLAPHSLSNQIIHYKDADKLNKNAFVCPYLVYGNFDKRVKVWLLANNYPIAKGLYFALSEKDTLFADYRDDVLVCDLKQTTLIKSLVEQVHLHKAGYYQRIIDMKLIKDYDQLLSDAKCLSEQICHSIYATLNICGNKAKVIQKAVEQWFLLKKCVYVQYMVDKKMLLERHQGDTQSQRMQAKANADAIRIIAYASLWKSYSH